ncbi:MAG TPA: hypothetical protein VGH97_04700 [Thermoanaerobaculia bacterium]|jgi:hypothetical protein
MRVPSRRAWAAGAAGAALALTLLVVSCGKSDSVTNPMTSPAAAVSLDGAWSGTFRANTAGCTSPVTVTIQQNGSDVRGIFAADNCKIRGALIATLSGTALNGKIEMSGCKGGAVMGTASASAMSVQLGDFWSPSDFGDKILLYGGAVTLQK